MSLATFIDKPYVRILVMIEVIVVLTTVGYDIARNIDLDDVDDNVDVEMDEQVQTVLNIISVALVVLVLMSIISAVYIHVR